MTNTLSNMPLPLNADILIFKNPQFGEVRVRIKTNGKVAFSALNVAKSIGYTNPKEAVSNICLGGVFFQLPVEDGFMLVKFIKHRDVYRLVNNLWSQRAKAFEQWFKDDILPAIRSYRAYAKLHN